MTEDVSTDGEVRLLETGRSTETAEAHREMQETVDEAGNVYSEGGDEGIVRATVRRAWLLLVRLEVSSNGNRKQGICKLHNSSRLTFGNLRCTSAQ